MELFIRVRSIASNKYVSDINTQAAFIAITSVMWCSWFCHRRAQPLHLAFAFLWQKYLGWFQIMDIQHLTGVALMTSLGI